MANDNILNAKKIVDDLTSSWDKHITTLTKSTDVLSKLNKEYGKVPSEYIKSVKALEQAERERVKTQREVIKNDKELEKLERERLKTTQANEKAEKANNKAITSRIPTLKQLASIKKQQEAQDKRELALLNRTQGAYNQLQTRVNKLTLEYNNLAAKKELGQKLTRAEASSLEFLEAQLLKYQGILKKVDANIGKHTRNVGNYASGWNGLSNSINQLTREMPAFANSVQTGFMALSNNIPMFVDEVNRLIATNKQLIAQGKPVTSVFSQIMKSLLSFQTLMGIGITLLIVYGKEIGEWASSMFKASESTDALSDGVKAFDENTTKSIGRLKTLTTIVQDTTRSEKDRLAALKLINEEYPELHTNLSLEEENLNKVNSAVINYIKLAVKKANIALLEEETAEKIKETVLLQQELNKLTINENDIRVKAYRRNIKALQDENLTFSERSKLIKEGQAAYLALTVTQRKYFQLSNQIKGNELEIQDIVEKYIDDVDLSTKATKKNTIAKKENEQITKNSEKAFEKQIEVFTELRKNAKTNTAQWKFYNSMILILEKSLEGLTKGFKKTKGAIGEVSMEFPDLQKNMEEAKKTVEALRAETDAWIKGFSDDFFANSPLGSLAIFFDGTFEKLFTYANTSMEKFAVAFNAISESAQQAFNFINQLSEQSFTRQYDRLEQQKDIAIQFAGESTAAREEIERQYEDRRKAIQRQQAKAQKQAALFNTITNTAQAVVASLAVGPPQGFVLAALSAALGAAQIAVIQSQPIPQYWEGGVHTGGLMMVNDDPYGRKGSNYREVVQRPDGTTYSPKGKNVLLNEPKGTVIHPTYDAFINSLDNELISNNIMPIGQSNIPPMIVNNGLTKGEVLEVMNGHARQIVSTIKNQHGVNISIDENGINKYVSKQGNTKKIMNARYNGKGISV